MQGEAFTQFRKRTKNVAKLLEKNNLRPLQGVKSVTLSVGDKVMRLDDAVIYHKEGYTGAVVFGNLFDRPQQDAPQEAAENEQTHDEDSKEPENEQDGFVRIVMKQANCSREQAVKALEENDNDVVGAVMSLTI